MHTPRPDQLQVLKAIKASYRRLTGEGKKTPHIAVQVPTGGGKTLIEVIVALGAVKKGGKVMVATGREELVLQAAADIREETPCGIVMAGHPSSPELPIQVCSIPTLTARSFAPDGLTHIIFDEGHHAKAETWKVLPGLYPDLKLVLAFSATPLGLGAVCDDVVVGPSVRDLEAVGTLVPSTIWRPTQGRVKLLARDPVEVLLQHPDRLSVTFADSVGASKEIAAEATAKGLPICHIDGTTRNRAELLAGLGTAWRGVSNFNVLTEGWNCPRVSLCLLGANTNSVVAYLQRVGRVLRAYPGKADALVYDLLGVSHVLGLPDEVRDWSEGGRGKPVDKLVGSTTCRKCGRGYRWLPRCPGCGFKSDPRPRIKVRWAEMSEAERARRAPPPAVALASFIELQMAKGWKPGAALARFRGVFGRDATAEERAEARVLVEGRKVA